MKSAPYLLNQGDLRQLADQERFLRSRGFNVGNVDVFPAVDTKEEYVSAMRFIYESCVNGWWNYHEQYITNGICTDEDFKKRFSNYMERKQQP